jgi:hypothetical protein
MRQLIILSSSQTLDKETFIQNETLKRAYSRSIEIIVTIIYGNPKSFVRIS